MKHSLKCGVFAATCLFTSISIAQDISLENQDDKHSYALGMVFGQQIATSLTQMKSEVNHDLLLRALSDTITQQETLLTQQELQDYLQAEQKKQIDEVAKTAEQNKQSGEAFLATFANNEDFKKTENGIFYHELTAGDGAQPIVSDSVRVHYKGTLKDGTEFDSSYARGEPAEFPVGGVIQGWQEILPMMKTGSKWRVVIPAELAYGQRGAGSSIGPNEPLVFEIELLEIK